MSDSEYVTGCSEIETRECKIARVKLLLYYNFCFLSILMRIIYTISFLNDKHSFYPNLAYAISEHIHAFKDCPANKESKMPSTSTKRRGHKA